MHTFLDCSVLLARKSLSQHDGNSHSERESQSSIMTDIISITFVITGGGAIGGLRGALPPQVVVFHTMSTCSTLPGCAVLTELRNQDSGKAIADYAGLHSTSEETKIVAPSCPLKF